MLNVTGKKKGTVKPYQAQSWSMWFGLQRWCQPTWGLATGNYRSISQTLRERGEAFNLLGDDTITHPVQWACQSYNHGQTSPVSTGPQEIYETCFPLGDLTFDGGPDFLDLELHQGVLLVTVGMQAGKNTDGLLLATVLYEPLDNHCEWMRILTVP